MTYHDAGRADRREACNSYVDLKKKLLLLAQLWRLTDCSKLENGFFPSWEFDDKIWSKEHLEGKEVYIEEKSTERVLAIDNNKVVLRKEPYNSNNTQKWVKSAPDADGWFTLKMINSNKFLTSSIIENKNDTIDDDDDDDDIENDNDDESIKMIVEGK